MAKTPDRRSTLSDAWRRASTVSLTRSGTGCPRPHSPLAEDQSLDRWTSSCEAIATQTRPCAWDVQYGGGIPGLRERQATHGMCEFRMFRSSRSANQTNPNNHSKPSLLLRRRLQARQTNPAFHLKHTRSRTHSTTADTREGSGFLPVGGSDAPPTVP